MRELDVLGIGFGPANLALAAALEEGTSPFSSLFLEKQSTVAWHPGMLFPDARIQITIHKDLALPRNPRSALTFLSFLHERGRLLDYLSLGEFLPSRAEYNEYLRWAAEKLGRYVSYGREVVRLEVPAEGSGLIVHARTTIGKDEAYRAKNVVLAPGGDVLVPAGVELGPRVVHPSQYVQRLEALPLPKSRPPRFVVVGAGQSAAEIFDDLTSRYPSADVTGVFRGLSYRVLEEHASINQAFLPALKDSLDQMSSAGRARLRQLWDSGNYRVVNEWLIQRIYHRLYDERVVGKERARLVPLHELRRVVVKESDPEAVEREGPVVATFLSTVADTEMTLHADAIFVATGYRYDAEHPLLATLAGAVVRDQAGRVEVDASYRARLHPDVRANLFLSGRTEDFHGPGEPLLAMVALRAAAIVAKLEA